MKKLFFVMCVSVSLFSALGHTCDQKEFLLDGPHGLFLSNSTVKNRTNYPDGYLEYALPWIQHFFRTTENKRKNILFIPYADVIPQRVSPPNLGEWPPEWEAYTSKARKALAPLGIDILAPYDESNKKKIAFDFVNAADGFFVGGGSTPYLLATLYETGMFDAIQHAVNNEGKPYLGSSAGTIAATATIQTTNDMFVVIPRKTDGMRFLPCVMNAHYYAGSAYFKGPNDQFVHHNGETRIERLTEYLTVNQRFGNYAVLLPEGVALERHGKNITIRGEETVELLILETVGSENTIKTSVKSMDAESLELLFFDKTS